MKTAKVEAPRSKSDEISFVAADGRLLRGVLRRPARPSRVAVVIHGGVGFPCSYYQDFAAWLCESEGVAVLTYDYRDFGRSRDRPLAECRARLRDWAITDQSAALSELCERFPSCSIRVIDHSLGGQWLAFHDKVERIDRAVAVASGPGYWRDHPWAMLPGVIVFWWMVGPAATRVKGYMPGRSIGLGADLPAQVYWEWRKLCMRPQFHLSEWGRDYPYPKLDKARFPIVLMPVADDALIAPHMVRKLPYFYPQAQISEILLDPKALGLGKFGHAGAFLKRNAACWPMMARALRGDEPRAA